MNLSFNNLSELDEFLHWANRYGTRRDTYTAGDGSAPDLEACDLRTGPYAGAGPLPVIDTTGVAFDTPQQPLSGNHVSLDDKVPEAGDTKPADGPPEPTKRKRRTKAEIEADAKAAAADTTKPITTTTYTDGTTVTGSGDHPVRSPAQQDAGEAALESARAVLRDKPQTPTGTNPFEQAATDGSAATGEPNGAEAQDAVVTPFQHLTRAREFIAKHGMPKYNESFAKAGLDANVMGYTAYQRALHMDALTALEAA